MKVEFAAEAIYRLQQIHEFVAADSPSNAVRLIERVIARAESLAEHAHRGRQVPEYGREDIREIRERPYRIIYRVTQTAVQILTVMHERRLLPGDPKILR